MIEAMCANCGDVFWSKTVFPGWCSDECKREAYDDHKFDCKRDDDVSRETPEKKDNKDLGIECV